VIAREGYSIIAAAAVLAAVMGGIGIYLDGWWAAGGVAIGVGLLAFTVYFFRDPDRQLPDGAAPETAIVAPADGRVVEVVDREPEPLYLDGPARRVSIFLSPLDVHVNRIPVSGIVEYEHYRPGDYLVAWHPKASEKNERSEVGVRHPSGTRVLFKQIAGAVARRIVYDVEKGDRVMAGERYGIVKFGSRMDLLVPPHVDLDVREGQTVRAGETVLGTLPAGTDDPKAEPATADSSTAADSTAADSTAADSTAAGSAEAGAAAP
jgi:phosphatidylserine decarboxylase